MSNKSDIVHIGFTGDFCPMERVEQQFLKGGWVQNFEAVMPFFNSNDLNIVDLECPLTLFNNGIEKTGPHIKAHPDTAEILYLLNCSLVVTANNHFKDFGWVGMKDTYDALQRFGVGWCGSGLNSEEASKPKEFEIKGLRFSLINMAENEWTTTHNSEPGCNPIDFPTALHQIQEAKLNGVDYIIVVLHGGHEHYPLPSPRMKSQFRFMIDAGADAVVGHHTHIISGYEVYKGKPIFYSLGNFCFDWPGFRGKAWNKGMLLRLGFDSNGRILFEYEFVHQNDDHVGLKLMIESDRIAQELEIERLNGILNNDVQLEINFSNYCETLKPIMQSRIQPYRNRLLVALNKRGLLPDVMGSSKKKMIKILAQCESHREVLLHALKISK